MSIIYTDFASQPQYNTSPYGNLTALAFPVIIANGKLQNGNGQTLAVGDEIVLGELPEGFVSIGEAFAYKLDGSGVANAGKLGFKYQDGVDDERLAQSDDFFSENKMARFPKNVHLMLKLTSIANLSAMVVIQGVVLGGM